MYDMTSNTTRRLIINISYGRVLGRISSIPSREPSLVESNISKQLPVIEAHFLKAKPWPASKVE